MEPIDLGPYPDLHGYAEAAALDQADPLSGHRENYIHSDPDQIYLDGNSLGRLPAAAVELVSDVTTRQWGDRLIESWNEGWWDLHTRLGDKLGRLIGAAPGQTLISDSTSVNLYKLAWAALNSAQTGRNMIVTDDLNFPSDLYILDGVASQFGSDLIVVASDGVNGPIDGLSDAIDDRTALVSLSHTSFTSGFTYDMSQLTAMTHDAGALVLWDCSHSVGVVPIDLDANAVDLAVGCTYKYLNGGPGSPAFLYVRGDLQHALANPIAGWWAHEAPFDLDLEFRPTGGIRRFHGGTMPILSLATIEAGIDDVLEAGIEPIRAKSTRLTKFLIEMYETHLEPLGFALGTPTEPRVRGSHVSIRHEMAWPINKAMIDVAKVVPDFRSPDNLRLGLSPLYTSFEDLHTAIGRIAVIVNSSRHLDFVDAHATVT